jgi:8-amino-7-oxononanoate synthase
MQKTSGSKLVVTDGVFSMDGDIAELPQLAKVCQKRQGWLMVDDAHGFGVMGKNGGGLAEHFNLTTEEIPILIGTLGKAFGTFGAFVAGSEELIETLVQFARTYIYTTALPPAVASASRVSLKILQQETWRREKLKHLINYFREGAKSLDINLIESLTPIQPVLLYDDNLVMKVANRLKNNGFLVGAIRPPTVPLNTSRLRITISAKHEENDIDALLESLSCIIRDIRIITK